jgi:hypothetical protein
MRQNEYERRRHALEAQLREDVELLRAGYQAKLRALEMLWLTSPGEALPAGPPACETLRLSETLHSAEKPPARETPPEPETPKPPDRALRRGQVMDDLAELFPELPEEFDRRDVIRVLGYEPPRATLFRALDQLLFDKHIIVTRYSDGRSPTRYGKAPEPEGGPG